MDIVRSQATIPIPRVYRYLQEASERGLLALQYIPGEILEKRWPKLSFWSKLWVLWKLRSYVRQLQRIRTREIEIPGPPGSEPQECHGPAFGENPAGSFVTYAEMKSWFARKYALAQRLGKAPPDAAPFNSMPLVFTHYDLHMRNVMMGNDGKPWLID